MPDARPKRIEFTLSDELWDRLNEARGFEPRASFVKRALDAFLAEPAYSPEVRALIAENLKDPVLMRQGFVDGQLERLEARAPVEKEPAVGVPLPKIAPRRTR